MAEAIDEICDLTPEEEAVLYDQTTAHVQAGTKGALRRERIGIFRRRAVAGLIKKGVDRAKALEMVGEFGDGSLWEWLIENGPDIVAFIKMIMVLFGL